MLLAEINGKRNEVVETDEDFLTSAVFGHLRQVTDKNFWQKLFHKALSVDGSSTDLKTELKAAGAEIEDGYKLKVVFWPCTSFGEPDIILHFRGKASRPIVIVVEVKLYSGKSSIGEDDQLCRYFDLLHDPQIIDSIFQESLLDPILALIYLTERSSVTEVLESIGYSKVASAGRRMFPLQWQDITEKIRDLKCAPDSVLGEVLRFLERRQYEYFRGIRDIQTAVEFGSGHFYGTTYFRTLPGLFDRSGLAIGSFYAN